MSKKMSLREWINSEQKKKGMSTSEAKKDAGKYKSISAAKKAGSLYYTDKNGKTMIAAFASDLTAPKETVKTSARPKARPTASTESSGPKTRPKVSPKADTPSSGPKTRPKVSPKTKSTPSGPKTRPRNSGRGLELAAAKQKSQAAVVRGRKASTPPVTAMSAGASEAKAKMQGGRGELKSTPKVKPASPKPKASPELKMGPKFSLWKSKGGKGGLIGYRAEMKKRNLKPRM